VLDAGTGTGAFAAALAERWAGKVWGVDPSPEMLEVARTRVPPSVGLKQGWAEALPFRDGWFERVVMRLVAHLVDRPVAFAEAARCQVKVAMVLRPEMMDPDKFEATVARNRGLVGDVFDSEKDALAWLLDPAAR